MNHYFLMPSVPFQKGVRFAAVLSSNPHLPNSRRRPLRGPSCGSQLSKRDPLICLQKGGRFAPVVVDVICCLQKDGCPISEGGHFAALVVVPNCPKETRKFAFVICCLRKSGSFAPVVVVICCLKKRRPLRGPSWNFYYFAFKKAAASRP